ncbi:MAG TPA: thioredoxin family protein [Steroidobacteraceae bacterium]|nr:thioredoxin family protein [Steroidobacteraceae bacterium]
MTAHQIVNHDDWLEARRHLLAKEKEFTRLRDELSRERRELPWEHVRKEYAFESSEGRRTLADLFAGHSQLIVYHFMYAPDWDIGCRGCSFWADNFNGIVPHLRARDVSLVAASRAPLQKLQAQARRFGWTFPWVSTVGDDFNRDCGVWFAPEALEQGAACYNYAPRKLESTDMPGISAFFRDGTEIYHSYSTYARGLDMLNAAYHYLDIAPKGRDEEGLAFPMQWVKHRIAYES